MMIYGIGTDILSVPRIEKVFNHFPERFINKILSEEEKTYLKNLKDYSKQKKIIFLAKRFAAKEAFTKSVYMGLKYPVIFSNISLLHKKSGAPYFKFHNALSDWTSQKGITQVHISLSDEKEYILSFVITQR